MAEVPAGRPQHPGLNAPIARYHTLVIRLLFLIAVPVLLTADEKWVTIRSGPFQVFSSMGERAAREQMEQLEQFRHGLGVVLGKQNIHLVWPVRIVVSKSLKSGTPGALPLARDAYIGVAGQNWKTLARLLIEQNTQRLPKEIEDGIVALFSTVQITGARITIGAPVPPSERTRDWARMHLLTVDPAYGGRARVMISNLEQGSELDSAYKNAFEKTKPQIEKQVDEYLAAGLFGIANVSGRPLNPARDLHVEQADADEAKLVIADFLLAN